MPFNASRTGSFYEKEVLKYSLGAEVLRSYVLDSVGASIAADSSSRYVWPAGTILKLNGDSNNKVIPYNGSGTIVGILESPAELVATGATSSDTAVATFSHNAVFSTTKIVGFTLYASALISSLPTCRWE